MEASAQRNHKTYCSRWKYISLSTILAKGMVSANAAIARVTAQTSFLIECSRTGNLEDPISQSVF